MPTSYGQHREGESAMSDGTDNRSGIVGYLRHNVKGVASSIASVVLISAGLAIADPVIGIAMGVVFLGAGTLTHWLRYRPFDAEVRHTVPSVLMSAALGVLVVSLVIQLVPYGRDHSNPPVTAEPTWDSPRTRELAVAACYDCHSNEVEWPWYSNVAPISWSTQRHVDDGREDLNFSEWDRPQEEADEAVETIVDGEMPPLYYMLTHPDARLSDAEKQELVDGLTASIGKG